ncbi:MAG: hypothetical protein K2Z81_02595, partial [Cyanobacteria bacterium]|nr:hypothetical protein [Cyanobacteriota bacterium]
MVDILTPHTNSSPSVYESADEQNTGSNSQSFLPETETTVRMQPADTTTQTALLDGSNPFTIDLGNENADGREPQENPRPAAERPAAVPALELVGAPEAQVEKPLTADEKESVGFLQSQLLLVYPLAFEKPEAMTAEEKDAQVNSDIAALKKEIEEHRFGTATRKAYAATIKWLEQAAVPGAVKELTRLALPLPAGTPIGLPRNEQGGLAGQDYYRSLVMADRLRPNLRIDATRPPSFEVLDTIDDTMKWLRAADDAARQARYDRQDQLLERQIRQIITNPEQQKAWLDRRGSEPQEWRAAAIEAIDLATRVKNYVEAMDSLHRAGKRFPIQLPAGCNVTRDTEGRITHVSLDLPRDLRLGHAQNNHKMDVLRKWLHDHGNQIDQAVKELIKLEENPDRLLFWGEIEMPHGLAKMDANGNVVDFVDPKKATGSETEFNLAQMRFDVQEKFDERGKKRIVVSNSVQYQQAHWYNYLNVGASDVGNKVNVETREYDPDDWVAIRGSGGVEVVQAKNLWSWKLNQQVFHYGEKVLIATLDATMLATGLIEVSAAYKAARAGQLVVSQAIKQAAKGALRAAVGLSGIVNNAYFKETDYGQKIQMARGLYFVGDAALGLGQGGWRMINRMRGVANTGKTASEIVSAQIKASRWARTYRYAERAAKLTEVPFAYIIFNDIGRQVDHLRDLGRSNPIHSAIRQAIEGRGNQRPEDRQEGQAKPIDRSTREIKRYKDLLKGGNNEAGAMSILDRAEQLSSRKSDDPERQKFLQDMMSHFMPDGEHIKDMELAGTFGPDRNRRHAGHSAGGDRTLQTAAAVAILSLTNSEDGALPEVLVHRTVDVPKYEREEQELDLNAGTSTTVTRTVNARTEKQELTTADIVSFLRRELETPRPESRLVALGDLALQVGCASGVEVAGALQDAISSPSNSEYE